MLTPDELQPAARGAWRGAKATYHPSAYGAYRERRTLTSPQRYGMSCDSPFLFPLTAVEGAGL